MTRNASFAKHAAEVWCQAVVVQRKCHPFSIDLMTVWFGPIRSYIYRRVIH
jgi:hypothetical protein